MAFMAARIRPSGHLALTRRIQVSTRPIAWFLSRRNASAMAVPTASAPVHSGHEFMVLEILRLQPHNTR